jgi:hypothetical protein
MKLKKAIKEYNIITLKRLKKKSNKVKNKVELKVIK